MEERDLTAVSVRRIWTHKTELSIEEYTEFTAGSTQISHRDFVGIRDRNRPPRRTFVAYFRVGMSIHGRLCVHEMRGTAVLIGVGKREVNCRSYGDLIAIGSELTENRTMATIIMRMICKLSFSFLQG